MRLSSCRRVIAGGGFDLFGGVGSLPREADVFAVLQFLLEQELEVFLSFNFGLVLLGDSPEVELLCIPVQRSQRFVRCGWVPLRRRLPTLRNGVDGRSRERRKRSPWLLGFGRKKEFAVKKSRFLWRSRLLPRRRRRLHCPPVPLGTGTRGLPLPQ